MSELIDITDGFYCDKCKWSKYILGSRGQQGFKACCYMHDTGHSRIFTKRKKRHDANLCDVYEESRRKNEKV